MRIIATRIPPGSHEVAIWANLPPSDVDEGQPIDAVCNILRMNQYECIVTHAKGDLSDETNVALGLLCLDMGYHWMHFAVSKGHTVTRHGVLQKTAQGMDWYTVDLVKVAEQVR